MRPPPGNSAARSCLAGAGQQAGRGLSRRPGAWLTTVARNRALAELVPSPVVELNRAVAVAMADGPAAGLELVAALEASGALGGYHLLPATRADLLRRQGRNAEAAASYQEARELAATDAERRYLDRRLAETAG